jgi:hypothetical protein
VFFVAFRSFWWQCLLLSSAESDSWWIIHRLPLHRKSERWSFVVAKPSIVD